MAPEQGVIPMALDEEILELISRGLDADLDRREMRRLYRLVARDPRVVQEMGELAALEEGLADWAQRDIDPPPTTDLTTAAMARPERGPSLWSRLGDWLHSPQGISIQPFSFAGGLAVAALAMWIAVPTVMRAPPGSPPQRLQIHDVQFIDAKARVDWTNRFIVPAGGATRLSLGSGGEQPLHIQFETVEPVELLVAHTTPGSRRDLVQTVTVDGIGYASLTRPLVGDMLTIRNRGQVPVLVYMRSQNGTTFSRFQGEENSRDL